MMSSEVMDGIIHTTAIFLKPRKKSLQRRRPVAAVEGENGAYA